MSGPHQFGILFVVQRTLDFAHSEESQPAVRRLLGSIGRWVAILFGYGRGESCCILGNVSDRLPEDLRALVAQLPFSSAHHLVSHVHSDPETSGYCHTHEKVCHTFGPCDVDMSGLPCPPWSSMAWSSMSGRLGLLHPAMWVYVVWAWTHIRFGTRCIILENVPDRQHEIERASFVFYSPARFKSIHEHVL